MTKLSEIKIGKQFKIEEFIDNTAKCYSARFGIEKGQIMKCIAKPGPVIIQKKNQEIAIGKNLSDLIAVNVL